MHIFKSVVFGRLYLWLFLTRPITPWHQIVYVTTRTLSVQAVPYPLSKFFFQWYNSLAGNEQILLVSYSAGGKNRIVISILNQFKLKRAVLWEIITFLDFINF